MAATNTDKKQVTPCPREDVIDNSGSLYIHLGSRAWNELSFKNPKTYINFNNVGNDDEDTSCKSAWEQYKEVLVGRIVHPVKICVTYRNSYFFKPHDGLRDWGLSLMHSALILGVMAFLPEFLPLYAYPAGLEILNGLYLLVYALFLMARSFSPYHQSDDWNDGKTFFIDAGVKGSIGVALAVLCVVSLPIEVIRFVTKTISDIGEMTGLYKLYDANHEQELKKIEDEVKVVDFSI